jgi:hypothetical protein
VEMERLVAGRRRVARRKGGTVLLAIARDDVLHRLFVPLLVEVCVVLRLGDFPCDSQSIWER